MRKFQVVGSLLSRCTWPVTDNFIPRNTQRVVVSRAVVRPLGAKRMNRLGAAIAALLLISFGSVEVLAQKSGGVLKMPDFASPASMSIHEEITRAAVNAMMPVFNNLVLFDQHKAQNTIDTIVPDLAESWSWDAAKTALTFKLRHAVKWHDGKPFTAADVKCTWDLLQGKASEKFRLNPRKSWYRNLDMITTNGDDEVTFHLKRPQPYLLVLLASAVSPVYPCHVPPAQMRQHPIGTGPFKFVEYKPNETIKLTRNTDYWKPGRPYLDGIEFPIVASVATRNLMFIADNVDMTLSYGVSMPLLRDIKSQVADAICEMAVDNGARNLIINPARPPFDNPDLRRALSLTLDRKAFIDILVEGQGQLGGAMQPPPDGVWGMPPDMLATLPGYEPDVAKNRADARAVMERLGYGPNNRLSITVSTRNTAGYRDPAVIAIDQMKEIYIDGVLEPIETANWFPKVIRKDYTVGANISETAVDDPDQMFYENYACGSDRNYTGFCDEQVDALIDRQSSEADPDKRRQLVWEIERILARDASRPIIFYTRVATCWHPRVKGLTIVANSVFNGWRFEDVWLDR
jgi:peptide/nickel transport system substrate-binding protein